MSWALSGRSTFAFAVAIGVLVGAGAAVIGIDLVMDEHPQPRVVEAPVAAAAPARVVDISRSAFAHSHAPIASVLGLEPLDPIVTVDGMRVGDGAAAVEAAWAVAPPGEFIDLETASGRRVLVLVHS
jgi:hypothetical protein